MSGNRTYRWEGFVFNLLCGLAYVLLGPVLVETASLAVDGKIEGENESAVWLGSLIILVSLLEIYAFPVKMRYIREAIRANGDDGASGFVLWMFHTVVSVILVFVVFATFGVPMRPEKESEPSALMMGAFFIVVIKELGFLLCLIIPGEGPPDPAYARPSRREKIVDLILLAYALVVHCVVWGTISRMELQRGEPVMFVVNSDRRLVRFSHALSSSADSLLDRRDGGSKNLAGLAAPWRIHPRGACAGLVGDCLTGSDGRVDENRSRELFGKEIDCPWNGIGRGGTFSVQLFSTSVLPLPRPPSTRPTARRLPVECDLGCGHPPHLCIWQNPPQSLPGRPAMHV
jgi:hypothetical protein